MLHCGIVDANYYIPDLVVIPTGYDPPPADNRNRLTPTDEPMTLVVEIWSPSTGGYDLNTKVPAYQARAMGIWRLPRRTTL